MLIFILWISSKLLSSNDFSIITFISFSFWHEIRYYYQLVCANSYHWLFDSVDFKMRRTIVHDKKKSIYTCCLELSSDCLSKCQHFILYRFCALFPFCGWIFLLTEVDMAGQNKKNICMLNFFKSMFFKITFFHSFYVRDRSNWQ